MILPKIKGEAPGLLIHQRVDFLGAASTAGLIISPALLKVGRGRKSAVKPL